MRPMPVSPSVSLLLLASLVLPGGESYAQSQPILWRGKASQLDVRLAGERVIRLTLKPVTFEEEFPFTPALSAERTYSDPVLSLREIEGPLKTRVGNLQVEIQEGPRLVVTVRGASGDPVQTLAFEDDGTVTFEVGAAPVLGMGEGGPQPGEDWRENHEVEFDRRGRYHEMRPRWQSNAYGSRNPVALLIGTGGWGLYVATPWVHVELPVEGRGRFIPWERPEPPGPDEREGRSYEAAVQGRPPATQATDVFDVFVFDARDPAGFMKDVAYIAGAPVMPPKWALGYMQSHRELRDDELTSEELILDVVDTFREKRIPVDAVIYLGTGFTPTGWNTEQPSFDFNPEVFARDPAEVIRDLHARNVKVLTHIVPWRRDRLPTLHGSLPPGQGEILDGSHIFTYWQEHVPLVRAGVDAWWPDEGDWLDLFERIKRHQLYYQGPLWSTPNVRPWSLHRNGHLGIAQWGGWVWSGDTQSTWKTLEAQIAVGINHSLSLSPYWGSDTGGFYTTNEFTGELYARWFQFSSFNPSFRSHGRIWRLRLPWGWGLSDWGFPEGQRELPPRSAMGDDRIEAVNRRYAELRYQLIPYTYTLAREAHDKGMPLMRALWLHYPMDERARGNGSEFLWGRDLLIAPVFEAGARSRRVYLPEGEWYDWWTLDREVGGRDVTRPVDLETMPIYARAGAIIPFDPVRQFLEETVEGPTTLKVFSGADGEFTLYEDDGVSLDYLENRATWTHLGWNDQERVLTIEPGGPEDGINLLPESRIFRIELLPGGESRIVEYRGSRLEVRF